MAMNTKLRLCQRLAFNLIVAVVIGVRFGARQGVAQQSVVGEWSTVNPLALLSSPYAYIAHG